MPHEDPSAVQSSIDAYSFLTQYAAIFALISDRQYNNASMLNKQLNYITVPADLSYVINRYDQLTQQLITTLSDLQATLDTTTRLLGQNRLSEAAEQLDHASVLVTKAQILVDDLKEATQALSERLGVFAAPVESKVWEAYTQLQSMLQKLRELIDLYQTLLDKVNREAEEFKKMDLNQPTLSLVLNTTKCFVGGYVAAQGSLTCKGSTLANRIVVVNFDGIQVATLTTDQTGAYHGTLKIPYKYVDSAAINAIYTPQGSDINSYLASLSSTVKLQILYFKTSLSLNSPGAAYPGLSFTVTGAVNTQDGVQLNQRQVNVQLDDRQETRPVTDEKGVFTTTFTIDSQIPLGRHNLTVTIEPKELYGPASASATVITQKKPTQLQITAPQFILLPTQLEVEGTVKSASSPLLGTIIQIEFSNITATAKTKEDGRFNLTIGVPLNTALAGYQELNIKAQPAQPWQATVEQKTNVFALNSVSTGLALALSVSVFTITFFRFAKSKQKNAVPINETVGGPQTQQQQPLAIVSLEATSFEGYKGTIIKTYVDALRLVQKATGTCLTATLTLREYTQQTKERIGEAAEPFKQLTLLTEKSLYSPHPPQPQEESTAEELANIIRRKLYAAAP